MDDRWAFPGAIDMALTARIYTHVGIDELRDAVDSLPTTTPQTQKRGA